MVREILGFPLSIGVLVDALVNGFAYLDVVIEALLSVSGSLFIASSIGLDRIAPRLGIDQGSVQLIVTGLAAMYVTHLAISAWEKYRRKVNNATD